MYLIGKCAGRFNIISRIKSVNLNIGAIFVVQAPLLNVFVLLQPVNQAGI